MSESTLGIRRRAADATVNAPPGHSGVMTKAQTAVYLQLTERTVQRLLKDGYLTRVPGISHIRISREAIDAYLRGETGPEAS